jgi:hypothetical protein
VFDVFGDGAIGLFGFCLDVIVDFIGDADRSVAFPWHFSPPFFPFPVLYRTSAYKSLLDHRYDTICFICFVMFTFFSFFNVKP